MRKHILFFAMLSITVWLFAGCTSEQLYASGQAWQRTECNKINDAAERGRCRASASTSYDEYQRQADAAKGSK